MIIFLALAIASWTPVWEDLVFGQLTLFLLVLLMGAWLALRSGRNIWGGVLLGSVLAFKLLAWPVLIFLAWRKNWRAVGASIATVLAANLLAALLMGFDTVINYYLKIGPSITALYRAQYGNFSIWTFGWRLFSGTVSELFVSVQAPPLIAAPAIAPITSYALVLIFLVGGLALAIRARSFDAAFGMLVCVSLLVNPVVWSQYLALAVIPIAIAARRLFALGLPNKETLAALAVGALLLARRTDLDIFISSFATRTAGGTLTVPFALGLIALIPALAIIGLLWFVWRLDRMPRPLPVGE
jgi:hypothetical protein